MVNTTSKEMGKLLGQQMSAQQQIKEEGFGNELVETFPINPIDDIRIPTDRLVITKQLIGSAFILGHPVNGELGNSSFSLGAGGLGASSDMFITHSNNNYIERFGTLAVTDVGSSLISTSDFNMVFVEEVVSSWKSKPIYYDASGNNTFDSFILTAKGTGRNNLTYCAYLDDNNCGDVTLNTPYVASTAFSKLELGITNEATQPGWATPFGTWGLNLGYDATLTELNLIYGNGFGSNTFTTADITPTTPSGPFNGHATLADNIVAYWKEDTAAQFEDSVANFDGTITGAVFTASGLVNSAYDWDGVNDKVSIGDLANLPNFASGASISLWFKNADATLSLNKWLISTTTSLNTNSGKFFALFASATSKFQMGFRLSGGSAITLNSLGTYNGNTSWHHAVAIIDGTDSKLYIDNVLQDTQAGGTVTPNAVTEFLFGMAISTGSNVFKGTLDEMAIWDRKLTASEISDLYNSGNGLQY